MNYGQVSKGPGGFQNFQSGKYLAGTKEFLNSNSLVAKFAFLIMVISIFYFISTFRSYVIGLDICSIT